ncbi:MAG: hypothetical protein ACXVOI_05520, partial [Tumebacillaceae bacterium]
RFSMGIYNPVFYRVSGRENEELDDQHLHDLIGREITGLFILDDQRLEFTLDDSSVFTISLRTEDFIGPEAAEIHFDTGEIIIFN